MKFEQLKIQFPNEIIQTAEACVPAAKQLKEDLLSLARAASNILERFKELVLEDFARSDD